MGPKGFADFALEPYFLFGRVQIFALVFQNSEREAARGVQDRGYEDGIKHQAQQIVYNIYCLRLRLLTMMKRQLNAPLVLLERNQRQGNLT